MACLYQITSPSGKSYIGISSKSTEARWRQHKANANKGRGSKVGNECTSLYSAIRKYGSDTFTITTLMIGSFEYVKEMEIRAIRKFGTKSPTGYNLTDGGDGAVGAIVSDETRRKQSKKVLQRLQDPVARDHAIQSVNKASEIRRNNWWGKTDAERYAWCRDHSERQSIVLGNPVVGAKISAALLGVKRGSRSDEVKLNMSKGAVSRWEKHGEKEKQSARKAEQWKDPVFREMMLAAQRRARDEKAKV